ncbi:UDP-glycosyltransferase 73C4-like [Oryza brachyantha]|uniref:Glycosyltransferase n=1 Tax=Oryza brachyantha TaxID=4533 RepID=J3MCA5_ORYBR|nr:UDP-glycosyltransferase 73C4-like [Oryza brachyantha]
MPASQEAWAALGRANSGDVGARAHFVFVPLMFQGHFIPSVDTALMVATHGAVATVVVTASYAARVRRTVDLAAPGQPGASPVDVRVVALPLDCAAAGLLADGSDDIDRIPLGIGPNYFRALSRLREPLERRLRAAGAPYPTCIVSDFCLPWTQELAASLGVPRVCFFSMCAFYLLCQHYVDRDNALDGVVGDDVEVIVPGMGDKRLVVTRAQAPGFFRLTGWDGYGDAVERALDTADGIVMNTFTEMEPEFVAAYAAARGKKVWTIGPVSLYHRHTMSLAARGRTADIDADECIQWLDSKEPNSVVYVSFGSIAHTADPEQVVELALGLEASGRPFIWMVKSAELYGETVREFLRELEARVAGRGLLIRGWAPQVLILSHVAVGGFVTHCGWNSILEAIAAGLPVVTWPRFSDQYLNQKMAVEVLGIGVSVGIVEEGKDIVVGRTVVEKAIGSILDGGEEGEKRRKRARALAEKARTTVQEGGSSRDNLFDFVQSFRGE